MMGRLLDHAVPASTVDPTWTPTWHVEGLLQRHAFNLLFGPPKSCKTNFYAHLLACAMTGTPVAGQWDIGTPVQRALILRGEEHSLAEAARLHRAFGGIGHRADRHDIRIVEPAALHQCHWSLDDPVSVAMLANDVVAEGIDLVILDALTYFHRQDENSNSGMGQVCAMLTQLKQVATVLVVHHTPDSNSKKPRGASVLRGAYDLALCLRRHGEGSDADMVVLDVDARYGEALNDQALHILRSHHPVHGQVWEWRHGGEAGLEMLLLEAMDDRSVWTVRGLAQKVGKAEARIGPALTKLVEDGLVRTEIQGKTGIQIWRRA